MAGLLLVEEVAAVVDLQIMPWGIQENDSLESSLLVAWTRSALAWPRRQTSSSMQHKGRSCLPGSERVWRRWRGRSCERLVCVCFYKLASIFIGIMFVLSMPSSIKCFPRFVESLPKEGQVLKTNACSSPKKIQERVVDIYTALSL